MEIKGNTVLAKFIRQNLDELINRKTNILNPEWGFIYLHPDGEFKEGRSNEYGQSIIQSFGGICQNKYSAIGELQDIINLEPFDNDDTVLKGYLK